MEVKSAPGLGVQVKIVFDRADGARPS
jgi:hypothetical protein